LSIRRYDEEHYETVRFLSKSRWAQLASEGKKVMQFLSGGRYVANVVDGKATIYGKLTR
jgi:hypothetical protein